MALELRQHLKLTQQLVMTPQLQQAIKLLQLSRLELLETVQQELLENPFLEEAENELAVELDNSDDLRPQEEQLMWFTRMNLLPMRIGKTIWANSPHLRARRS